MKILIVDNYDSFTYNLYQLVGTVTGIPPIVIRNDELTWDQFVELAPDRVILSPGPGHPDNARDFGICRQILLESNVPVLGVCLGLQGLASVFGGTITHGPEPRHGRLSTVHHDGSALFSNIPGSFQAVRYHSLIVAQPVPDCLRITARTEDNLIMGLAHRERPLFGVQFHPESIATEYGEQLLRNFIAMAPEKRADEPKRSLRPPTHWQTFSRKLTTYPTAEDTFCELFAFERPAFWLDSSDGEARRSRFSFMGTGTLIPDVPVFDYLKNELRDRHCSSPELPFDFNGGFVGYFGYELKSETGGARAHRSPYPDSRFLFVDRFLAFDHQERCLYLVFAGTTAQRGEATTWLDDMEERLETVSVAPVPRPAERTAFSLEQDRDAYLADVATCLEEIRNGESYEICLTNRLRATSNVDPLDYYRVLRRLNPAPYSAFLRFNELSVACSSPERFLKIDRARNAESRPIKGTLRRSSDPVEDQRLRETLRTSVKTRAENLMIVDLLRNDIGRLSRIGTVRVPQLFTVETYNTLHQMTSTVEGELAGALSIREILAGLFPCGSVTGAPKIRAMEIIRELEATPRGVYCGAIGRIGADGSMRFNVAIRTLTVLPDNRFLLNVGSGLVADSRADTEYEECLLKARFLNDSIGVSA